MQDYPYQRFFTIVFEDNHLLIVNKAPGLLSQGDNTGDLTLLDHAKKYIKVRYEKPGEVFCGLAHRLDRPVSGLVVLAKTSKGLERMTKIFRERKVSKTYWAVTRNRPNSDEGTLTNWLLKDRSKNKVQAFDRPREGAQKATLHFRVIGKLNKHFLIEVTPVTGRPHQIRVQLAAAGCPIRGDVKYGFRKPNSNSNINLHAKRLDFIHPVRKEPVVCIAGLPRDPFWEEFLALDDYKVKEKLLEHTYSG